MNDRRKSDIHLQVIEDKLESIYQLQIKHDKALYSEDGTNGIVRDVNNMKQTMLILKWIIGFLGLGFFTSTVEILKR